MNDITHSPVNSVWEVTMGCNMRCMHCGSACSTPLEGELTTEEALKMIDQMGDVGLKSITLSGGEPTTRKDIFLLARALHEHHIYVSMISNGWLIDEGIVDQALWAGISNIGISLDGVEKTHDILRRSGSFARGISAIDLMYRKGLKSGVITTINRKNLHELPEIWKIMKEHHVTLWQLQLALPMGNLKDNQDELMIMPQDLHYIIDYAHGFALEKGENDPKLFISDDIGYYDVREIEIKKLSMGEDAAVWPGCGAGKSGFGVLHNGDIVPCTSIRNKEHVQGNIRDISLAELWRDGFKDFRSFSHKQLNGFCADCMYSPVCRGGCTNSRFCVEGCIGSENKYCLYYSWIKEECDKLPISIGINEIKSRMRWCDDKCEYQLMNYYTQRLISANRDDDSLMKYLLGILGYSFFRLELYDKAITANRQVLEMDDADIFAQKGLGLSLYMAGEKELGKSILYACANNTDISYMEPYKDLMALLNGEGDYEAIRKLFVEARRKDPAFRVDLEDISNGAGV